MPHSSHLALTPPPGFRPAQNFHGFLVAGAAASIHLVDMPASMETVAAGFTDEEGLQGGVSRLERVDEVVVEGRAGRLYVHVQPVPGGAMVQWTLAVGEGDRTALAVAAAPAEVRRKYETLLREALLSLRWRPEGLRDPLEGLGFLVDAEAFAIRQRMGERVLLADAPPSAERPAAVVIERCPLENRRIVNRERFAVRRLHENVIRVFERREHGPVVVGGLQGFRTTAAVESVDPRFEGQRRQVAQWVLFGDADYFVAWAEMAEDDAAALQRFDAVATSFVRVDADGEPKTAEVLPPRGAETTLRCAFDLALANPEAGGDELGRLLARACPDLDPRWATAYAAEAWFLRHNVRVLAPIMSGGPGEPMNLESVLRERLPGFDEDTLASALALAEQIRSARPK